MVRQSIAFVALLLIIGGLAGVVWAGYMGGGRDLLAPALGAVALGASLILLVIVTRP